MNNPIKKGVKDINWLHTKETCRWQISTWKVVHHMSLGNCKSKQQWVITTHVLKWIKFKMVRTSNVGEDIEKQEFSFIVGGNEKCYSHLGRQFGSFYKTTLYDQTIVLLGI